MRPNLFTMLKRNPAAMLYASIVVFTIGTSAYSILKHYAFMSTAWDLGIYEQVLWSTVSAGRPLWYTLEIAINPSFNFFGIHFSPILFLIMPIYAAFKATETLLVLQCFILALGAVPLYKIVVYETHNQSQGLTFGWLYLAYPPLYGILFFDFHVQAFLPCLFLFTFYYMIKEDWRRYFLFLILSLMVIEFVPLIVVFLGFYSLWLIRKEAFSLIKAVDFRAFFRNKRISYSVLTIVVGILWFLAARNITLGINPSAPPHPNWRSFGDPVHDPLGLLTNIFTHPLETVEAIVTPADLKALYIFGLFAPLAFLSFLDLPSLMICAPWFLVAFLSSYPPYYTPIGYQYIAFVVPFIFLSAIYGLRRLTAVKNRRMPTKWLTDALSKMNWKRRTKRLYLIGIILVLALSYVTILGIKIEIFYVTEHDVLLDTFVSLVPSNASVLTQNDIFPHMSRRLYGFVGGGPSEFLLPDVKLDYILIDTGSKWYDPSLEDVVRNLTRNEGFGAQYAADGIWLLKRDYVGQTINPLRKGVFAQFYRQGVSVKFYEENTVIGPPIYVNLTLHIRAPSGLNVPSKLLEKPVYTLVFEGSLYAPLAGNYSFQIESFGLSSLLIGDNEVLNSDGASTYTTRNSSATLWLEKGFHSVKVKCIKQYYELHMRLLWLPVWATSFQEIPASFLSPIGSPAVSLPFLDIELTRTSGSPFVSLNENYTAFISSTLRSLPSGIYRFKPVSNGNVSIYIDNQLVLSPFNDQNKVMVEIFLSAGNHSIRIEYMENQRSTTLSILWMPPESYQFERIPADRLDWQVGLGDAG